MLVACSGTCAHPTESAARRGLRVSGGSRGCRLAQDCALTTFAHTALAWAALALLAAGGKELSFFSKKRVTTSS